MSDKAGMILAFGKPKDDPAADMGAEDPEYSGEALKAAADDIFDAVKSDNREKFRASLDAYCELWAMKEDSEPAEQAG